MYMYETYKLLELKLEVIYGVMIFGLTEIYMALRVQSVFFSYRPESFAYPIYEYETYEYKNYLKMLKISRIITIIYAVFNIKLPKNTIIIQSDTYHTRKKHA